MCGGGGVCFVFCIGLVSFLFCFLRYRLYSADGGKQEGMGPIASACLAGKQKLAHTTHGREPGRRAGWLLSETQLNLPRFFLPSHSPRRVEWTYGWIRTIMGKLPVAVTTLNCLTTQTQDPGKEAICWRGLPSPIGQQTCTLKEIFQEVQKNFPPWESPQQPSRGTVGWTKMVPLVCRGSHKFQLSFL